MARPTHVLFDFFGTLVAYESSHSGHGLEATHRLLCAAGADLGYAEFTALWDAEFEAHERRALHSMDEFSMDAVCASFLSRVLPAPPDAALLPRFRDAFLAEWSRGVRYLPAVPELLARLAQRHTLVLVTNTHHAELVHGHLRAMEVHARFHSVVTSVEHGRRKPSPCIFQRALAGAAGKPESAVYVGDSFSADYEGALAAGLHPLLIDPERRHPVPDAHRIASVSETLARVEAWA